MGLKDKLKQYNEQHKEHEFHPLELKEGNVQAIFDRCLATSESKVMSRIMRKNSLQTLADKVNRQ